MKRPRKFLGFILVLLIINTLFFLAWYAFDLQGAVKGIIETEAGKALGGKLNIKSFTISDQQVYAEGIGFMAADSSLAFQVKSAQVRFNLLKIIFSGFKLKNILNQVEINQPDVTLNIIPQPRKPKVAKPRKKLELPDISRFFTRVNVREGRFRLRLDLPLKLGGGQLLSLTETLDQINISAVNDKLTDLKLSAVSANNGILTGKGVLDRQRVVSASLELATYIPQSIYHPEIENFSTELNLAAKVSQPSPGAEYIFDAQAFLWNTQALLLKEYQINLPYVAAASDGDYLSADISQSRIGSSSLAGRVSLTGLRKELRFEPSRLNLLLDLAMIDPALSGLVNASVEASGTIKDPMVSLSSDSQAIAFQDQSVSQIALQADYSDDLVTFSLDSAQWQNLQASIQGSFDPISRKLLAKINIDPLNTEYNELKVVADCDLELVLTDTLPHIKAVFNQLDLAKADLKVEGLSGSAILVPLTENQKSYLVDLDLGSADGTSLEVVGDLLDRNLWLSLNFNELDPAEFYADPTLKSLAITVAGSINGWMIGNKLTASSKLRLALDLDQLTSPDSPKGSKIATKNPSTPAPGKENEKKAKLDYETGLDLIGSYDLETRQGTAFINSFDGSFNDQPLNFDLAAELDHFLLKLNSLSLNQLLYLSGDLNLKQVSDFGFKLTLVNLDSQTVNGFYPKLELPEISGVNLHVSYNEDHNSDVEALLQVQEILLPGITPLTASVSIHGPPGNTVISGSLKNPVKALITMNGNVSILDDPDLQLSVFLSELRLSDLMPKPPAQGTFSGELSVNLTDAFSPRMNMDWAVDLSAPRLSITDIIELNDLVVKLHQSPELLAVDSLSVDAGNLASLRASGALDYNVLSHSFFEGDHNLNVNLQGELFNWLKNSVDMITDASGKSSLSCSIGTFEEQFLISEGVLDIENGLLALKDQTEAIREIDIRGRFNQNRFQLENATCFMGEGKLILENEFEEDSSSHFYVGFLDLGSFRLRITEPGFLANVPLFTAPRTLTNIVLKGQNSDFAVVKGPFDDMTISGEVLISNTNAVYPPNTDNLLSLIYSFRDAFSRGSYKKADPAPLPFTLDLMIKFGDNIHYTTYPANISIQPGGYLHLIYDGQTFTPYTANFTSEQGTIDFFGTIFQADYLSVNILDSQNILSINGSFYRRAADGTVITLSIRTDPDNTKPLLDRLTFDLSSDNPDDRTVTQMLARLRYNADASELTEVQEQSLLQDEALSLVSGNLNTSLISPFLYPVENYVRRLLKLDNFSISVGFIQNLFTEYSNDQLGDYTDMDQFMGDVTQFSSSILLNNLSVSMSKYLGRKLFLDYKFSLQEATDLQKRTKIVMSHDTSLRFYLPLQLRLSYTFKYEPLGENLTHEVMLQRSFRFWGL